MNMTESDRQIEAFIRPTAQDKKIHPGMPELEKRERPISFFEFWPGFVIYIPVILQALWLAVRYRGFTLPLNSNPGIHLSGMVGESKNDIFSMAKGKAREKIPDWCVLSEWASPEDAEFQARQRMQSVGLSYPLVAKPDIGCRGAGVRIVRSARELKDYIAAFPREGKVILQQLVPYEAEAGIFYIRQPGEKKGRIFSITLKYPPYVIGNGKDTLRQLIQNDERAGQLTPLYFKRHYQLLEQVLPEGQPFRLTFAGSHSRGCIFRDGREFITPALEAAFDEVANGLPEYYYGRIDIRFRDINSLMNGENYYILEINGASSEAAHIWDSRSTLKEVYRVLFYQYRTLFQLGWVNRHRGFRPPSLKQLLHAWKHERKLVRRYPDTE
ncbi:ATP-grasp domain-containing protein [Endozoicomonas gorgoniicola]|uniref:ATP-grasp domain-containing protein n=1 Tax=Endozoicomonas gorgoniicola TaxID=1234144 RepID=A0ABT3MZR8_9GAMM|nr:ATP-grasp domain-containing protein [Endozoicomonas gorgoniicola]MCW7554869.1 ATP-grasp domain-containing protein [Endozoicomonas gorgoniicola]